MMINYRDLIKKWKAQILKKDSQENEKPKDTSKIEGENLPTFFQQCFPKTNKLFEQAEYVPDTFDNANFVLNHILGLDTRTEINASFAPSIIKPNETVSVKITNKNFYVGYQSRIWKNLSIEERAQIVKWHFDYKKEQTKSKKMILRFVNDKEEAINYDTMGQMFELQNFIYINPEYLFSDYPLTIEHTLEHEFEHKKQSELRIYMFRRKLEKMNLYEKYISREWGYGYIEIEGADDYTSYLLYIGDPIEQVANIRGLKNIEKYMKDPNYQFVFNKREKAVFERFKNKTLYDSFALTTKEAKEKMNLSDEQTESYEEDRDFVVNKVPKICKLVLVKHNLLDDYSDKEERFYNNLDEIKSVEKQLKKDKENEELLAKRTELEKECLDLKESLDSIDKKVLKINNILKKIANDERTRIEPKMFDELNLVEK